MAPKRRTAPPVRSRSSSPAPTTTKAFDAELQKLFSLLCSIAGSRDRLTREDFNKALQELAPRSGFLAAGSGTSAVRAMSAENDYLRLLLQAEFDSSVESIDFPAFYVWQTHLLKEATHSFSSRKQMLIDAISQFEHQENISKHMSALEDANNVSELSQAIEASKLLVGPSNETLLSHEERLDSWMKSFQIKLVTLAGDQHEVEACRTHTIGWLRSEASKLFDKMAYRIKMAVSALRLDADDETLESCGLVEDGTEIGVTFGALDSYQEMPISEFFDQLLMKELCGSNEIDKMKARLDERSMSEAQLVSKFCSALHELDHNSTECEHWSRINREQEDRERELNTFCESKKGTTLEGTHKVVDAYVMEEQQVRESVETLKKAATETTNKVLAVKVDAEQILTQCMPALEGAINAIDMISKVDMHELFDCPKQSEAVYHVMKAVCICFELTPKADTLEAYFELSRKTWGSSATSWKLLDNMKNYDKDNVTDSVLRDTKAFVENDMFAPERMERMHLQSVIACCKWVRMLHSYAEASQQIHPMRLLLKVGEKHLHFLMEAIGTHEDRLQRLMYIHQELLDILARLET